MRAQFPPNRHCERSVAIAPGQRTPVREPGRHVATLLAMTNRVRVSRMPGLPEFVRVLHGGVVLAGRAIRLVFGVTGTDPGQRIEAEPHIPAAPGEIVGQGTCRRWPGLPEASFLTP